MKAIGRYTHSVNGLDPITEYNLIPTEGLEHFLDVTLGGASQLTTWYLALFEGNVSPAATWTGANFTANATENTSETEGYSGSNRLTWTPDAVASGKISNAGTVASFTFSTASSVVIYGAALLSAQGRGATSGVLASAIRFASARTLNDGDVLQLTYEVELTDS